MRGLSPTSLLKTRPEDRTRDPWTNGTELLAQMVEVMSVVATEGKHLKEPIRVPRPDHLRDAGSASDAGTMSRAVDALRATARVRRR